MASLAATAGVSPFWDWTLSLAYAATPPMRIRPEASSPEGKKMLEVYRDAVGRMQTKFAMHHPHSWRFQANTHLYPRDEDMASIFRPSAGENSEIVARHRKLALGTESRGNPGDDRIWATCPHHGQHFFPWHRLYLAYFEQIVEKIVEKPFALPYWGYLDKNRRQLPDMFRDKIVNGKDNPLYFAARTQAILSNGLLETAIPALSETRIDSIMKNPNLFRNPRRRGFSEEVEEELHDQIHGAIGTATGMGNTLWAARDPIFWLHHASIDRLWESWRQPAGDGSSARDPRSDSDWYKPKYAFVDTNGERSGTNGAMYVLRAADNLKYKYDKLIVVPPIAIAAGPSNEGPGGPVTVHKGSVAGNKIRSKDDSVTITLSPAVPEGRALGLSRNTTTRYDLALKLRTAPQPGVYRVYMKKSSGAGPEALVGAFSLFGVTGDTHEHGGGQGPADVTIPVDITDKVRDGTVDPVRPGSIIIRPSYLDDPVDITVNGADIIAK
jgi:tyrosinase